jgi:hypothetical protein
VAPWPTRRPRGSGRPGLNRGQCLRAAGGARGAGARIPWPGSGSLARPLRRAPCGPRAPRARSRGGWWGCGGGGQATKRSGEQATPQWAADYRHRPWVEHRISELIHPGPRPAQYRGRAQTRRQALFTAAVANLTRLAVVWRGAHSGRSTVDRGRGHPPGPVRDDRGVEHGVRRQFHSASRPSDRYPCSRSGQGRTPRRPGD